MDVCVYVYVCVRMCVYVYMDICVYVFIYIYMYHKCAIYGGFYVVRNAHQAYLIPHDII